MKAVVYTEYGSPDVLKLKEIDTPTPQEQEILIKVSATTVNYGDLLARHFDDVSPREFNMPLLFWMLARLDFGWRKPKRPVLGSQFAGEITAVGKSVTRFQPGDRVFGYTGQTMGAYAEYLVMPEDGAVVGMPANMRAEEAAVVPYGAIMALGLLRKAQVEAGQNVLIIGASGGIGSAAVQIAKHQFGATVTGVCSTPRVPFVEALGADRVIDYTQEDYTQSGETYDVIVDILGRSSFARCKPMLKPDGVLLYASFKTPQLWQMLRTSVGDGQKVVCALAPGSLEDLISVKKLVEDGKLTAVIDRCFPLDQTAAAHRYIEQGRQRGHVVITL